MKRLLIFPFGRLLIAGHIAAILGGCAVLGEAPASRQRSIKDDAPNADTRKAYTSRQRAARNAGDADQPRSNQPVRVSAKRVEPAPEGTSPSSQLRQQAASSAPLSSSIQSAGRELLPPPAQTTIAKQTTVNAEASEVRALPRPAAVERPSTITRPSSIDRPDASQSGNERPSTAGRRGTPQTEDKPTSPPPASETLPLRKQDASPGKSPSVEIPAVAPKTPPPAASPGQPASSTPPQRGKGQAASRATVKSLPSPPPVSPAETAGALSNVANAIERSELLLRIGNVSGSREVLQPAVTAGNADAITALGRTYDPFELRAFLVPPGTSDASKAIEFYTEAARLGSPDARRRLERLKNPTTDGPDIVPATPPSAPLPQKR